MLWLSAFRWPVGLTSWQLRVVLQGTTPFTFTATSSATDVVPASGVSVSTSVRSSLCPSAARSAFMSDPRLVGVQGAVATLEVTPTDKVGSSKITVMVTDSVGAKAQTSFYVETKAADGSGVAVVVTIRLNTDSGSVVTVRACILLAGFLLTRALLVMPQSSIETAIATATGTDPKRIKVVKVTADGSGTLVDVAIVPPPAETASTDTKSSGAIADDLKEQVANPSSALHQDAVIGGQVDSGYTVTQSSAVTCPSGAVAPTAAECPGDVSPSLWLLPTPPPCS